MREQHNTAPVPRAPAASAPGEDSICIWFRANRVLSRSLCVSAKDGLVHVSAHTARRSAPIASASAPRNQCGLIKHHGKVALFIDTSAFYLTHREAERISDALQMLPEVSHGAS